MLNLVQHLTKSRTYETLKQVQGDKSELFTDTPNLRSLNGTSRSINSGFCRRHILLVALYAHLVLRVFRGRSWDEPRLH
jgi:hypothetical protein